MEHFIKRTHLQQRFAGYSFEWNSSDSRKIKKGDLFLSLSGHKHEDNDFISEALSKGAATVATDKPLKKNRMNLPIFYLSNLREDAGEYASRFFGFPSKNMKIIALTGTNGKTSVTHFFPKL